MENEKFRMTDYDPGSRLRRLSPQQAQSLESAISHFTESPTWNRRDPKLEGIGLPLFLLPLAEFAFTYDQIIRVLELFPEDFLLDHRVVYFDFRLGRWCRHLEPSTIGEVLEEYLDNSLVPEEGMTFLKTTWKAFLKRRGFSE